MNVMQCKKLGYTVTKMCAKPKMLDLVHQRLFLLVRLCLNT